jgi:hypothetical protein
MNCQKMRATLKAGPQSHEALGLQKIGLETLQQAVGAEIKRRRGGSAKDSASGEPCS